MCDFHSAIVTKNGKIHHNVSNSHSTIAHEYNLGVNTDTNQVFWEWEWDGQGDVPTLESLLRGYDNSTPNIVVRAALHHAKMLKEALEEGKHLKTYFKSSNYDDVKFHSKKFTGKLTIGNWIHYLKNGTRHRTNGPASISTNGLHKVWLKNGIKYKHEEQGLSGKVITYYDNYNNYHRNNGPAIISDRSKRYYKHGKLHRTNGPAVIRSNGTTQYWKNGKWIKTCYK